MDKEVVMPVYLTIAGLLTCAVGILVGFLDRGWKTLVAGSLLLGVGLAPLFYDFVVGFPR